MATGTDEFWNKVAKAGKDFSQTSIAREFTVFREKKEFTVFKEKKMDIY